jgi:hypothetical protein
MFVYRLSFLHLPSPPVRFRRNRSLWKLPTIPDFKSTPANRNWKKKFQYVCMYLCISISISISVSIYLSIYQCVYGWIEQINRKIDNLSY